MRSSQASVTTPVGRNSPIDRVELFNKRLREPVVTGADYVAEVRALREAIEGDIRFMYFYRYPPNRVWWVLEFEKTWTRR